MDSLTIWGIWPLWPLKKEKNGLHLFKDKKKWLTTGGRKERVLASAFLILGAFLFFLKLLNFDILIATIATGGFVIGILEGEKKYLPNVYRED